MAATLDEVRVHRDSTPGTIDADLKVLWAEVGRDTPVARALMANLVVFCPQQRGAVVDFDEPDDLVPIDDVVRRHPSRVIVLHHSPSEPDARAPIAAAVAVITFGKASARYGVEQISVRLASAEASLPSVVRSLVRGDVPTSIWWTDDLSHTPPVGAVIDMGRQLIYDSRSWVDVRRGVLALAPFVARKNPPDFADLNWRRLTVMRQGLVHAAGAIAPGDRTVADIRITHAPGESALAWLLGGWLASRLLEGQGNAPRVHVEERGTAGEILAVSVGAIGATMTAERVVVAGGEGAKPFHLPVRRESGADAVAAELATLSCDVCLRDTLATLARFFAP
jgi:glucose-6-phosphate dehydrogenase assembly protein OpcA